MALPSSGAISFSQIQTEFGGSNPISLSEYYNTTSGIGLGISSQYSIPASGAIAVSNFYGAQKFNFYPTTTFDTSVTSVETVAVNVSSTSSLKDRWIILHFGGRVTSSGITNVPPSVSFTSGVTGSRTDAFNVYSSLGYSGAVSYQKISEGATSVNARCVNPIYRTGGTTTADGTYVPVSNEYGRLFCSVFIVSGIPTLTHYGLVSSGNINNADGSITLNATSTKSFAVLSAFENRTPITMTNGTYYYHGGYNVNPSVGNTTYTTRMRGRFHGILFNY